MQKKTIACASKEKPKKALAHKHTHTHSKYFESGRERERESISESERIYFKKLPFIQYFNSIQKKRQAAKKRGKIERAKIIVKKTIVADGRFVRSSLAIIKKDFI